MAFFKYLTNQPRPAPSSPPCQGFERLIIWKLQRKSECEIWCQLYRSNFVTIELQPVSNMGNKPGKAKKITQVKGQQPLFGASRGSVPTAHHYVEKKVV